MHLKTSSAKRLPFPLGLNVLNNIFIDAADAAPGFLSRQIYVRKDLLNETLLKTKNSIEIKEE